MLIDILSGFVVFGAIVVIALFAAVVMATKKD